MDAGVGLGQSSGSGETARRLSTHQQSVLIQVLRTFPDESVGVCYSPDSSDAAGYAEDFLTIFKAIDWSTEGCDPKQNLPNNSGSGLLLAVPGQTLPASAEALRDALRIYHLEVAVATEQSALCGGSNFIFAVTSN